VDRAYGLPVEGYAGMVSMNSQWALWSERPDSRADYAVLSCSDGQLRAAHFNQLITRFSPGSPDSDGALPRMTVGRVDIKGEPHVGLAIQTYSRQKDGVGRNIAPTSYFCLPYAALAERRVSYLGLYRALSEVKLPVTDSGPPITIDPEPFDPAVIAADILGLGADMLSTTAALLLTRGRRICVTQAEHTTLPQRLRFLDGVAALLPYGYRAKLTLSTWANSATRHRLRLFFAHDARDVDEPDHEVTPLPWKGESVASDGVERTYFELLTSALGRHGTAEVVTALAAKVKPRGFDETASAVSCLQGIIERLDRVSRLRSGAYTLVDLRNEIDEHDGDAAGLRDLLVRLIEVGDGADVKRIERRLGQLNKGDMEPLLRPLQDMAIQLLWSPADVRLQAFVAQAARCGYQDWFLSGLIDRPSMSPAGLENGLNAAAHLLMTNVVSDTAAYPVTCDALGRNIPVALQLIVQLAMTDDEDALGTGLDLVRNKVPKDISRPVDVAVAGRRKRVEAQEITGLAQLGPSCVHAVLAIASRRGHMHLVIDAFVEWLMSGDRFGPGHDEYWSSRLGALDPEDPTIRGKLDVLILMTGGRPSSMTQIMREHWRAYQSGFVQIWRHEWADRARMTRGLGEYLEAQRWPDAQRANDVHDLIRAIFPVGEPTIDGALERSRLTTHRLNVYQPVEPLRSSAQPAPPPLFGEGGLAGEALEVFQTFCQRGLGADAACEHLAREHMIPDARTAREVVRQLPATLTLVTVPTAQAWVLVLIRHLCAGTFGAEIARDFPRIYVRSVVDRVRDEVRMLTEFSNMETPEWHDDQIAREIDELRKIVKELSDITSKAEAWRLPNVIGRNRRGDRAKKSLPDKNTLVQKIDKSDKN
jgi:hypothetical protein